MANVEALFSQFAALYGVRFAQMWKGTELSVVKTVWAEALSGFTVREVRTGLKSCRARPWPPTLPEFLLLCRPAPDYEKLFAEAQVQISRRERGEDEWTSKSVYWAAVEFGFHDLRSMSWATAKTRWTRICCEKRAQEDGLPDIPAARQALPAPGKALTDNDTARSKLADIKAMLGLRGQGAMAS